MFLLLSFIYIASEFRQFGKFFAGLNPFDRRRLPVGLIPTFSVCFLYYIIGIPVCQGFWPIFLFCLANLLNLWYYRIMKGMREVKISTKGRYALRMMLDLAQHQGDGYVALKEIAARQGISKKYLEQIVPMLTRGDFLLTNRGYQGGYRLARTPEKYTVGEILRLTRGAFRRFPASKPSRICASGPRAVSLCRCGRGLKRSFRNISTATPLTGL